MGMGQGMPIPQAQVARYPAGYPPPGAYMSTQQSFSPVGTPFQRYSQMPQFSPSQLGYPAPGQYMPAPQSFAPSGMYGNSMARTDSGYSSASTIPSPQYSPAAPSHKRSYVQMVGTPAEAAASQPQAKRMRAETPQNMPPSYGSAEWQAARGMLQSRQAGPSQDAVPMAMPPPRAPVQFTGAQQARQMMGALAQYGTPAMKTPPPAPVQPRKGPNQPYSNAKRSQTQQKATKPQPPTRAATAIPPPAPPPPTLRASISYAPPPRPLSLEEKILTYLPPATARLQAIEDHKSRQAASRPQKTFNLEEWAVQQMGLAEGPLTSKENSKALVEAVKAQMKEYGPSVGTNPDPTVAAELEFATPIRVRWTVEAYRNSEGGMKAMGVWYPAECVVGF